MSAISKHLTKTGTVKRRGTTIVASAPCTVPYPADAQELQIRIPIESPYKPLVLYMKTEAVLRDGDRVTVDSIEYPIRYVEPWTWPPDNSKFYQLLIEEVL